MTDEELAAIRERCEVVDPFATMPYDPLNPAEGVRVKVSYAQLLSARDCFRDRLALLAEVDRLRAEVARLRTESGIRNAADALGLHVS